MNALKWLCAILTGWSGTDFVAAIHTGITPGGEGMDPEFKPWRDMAR